MENKVKADTKEKSKIEQTENRGKRVAGKSCREKKSLRDQRHVLLEKSEMNFDFIM